MIKRRTIRKLLAPTAGFRQAALLVLGGLILFAIGAALSFGALIEGPIHSITRFFHDLMSRVVPQDSVDRAAHWVALPFLLFGMMLVYFGARRAYRRLQETVNPGMKTGIVAEFRRRQELAQGPRIVALGGGTGLSTLLRGLKQYSSNITAIVTVTDDGGSSGRLIKDKGMIPPGDIRNCLVALADAEKSLSDLFQHRFKDDSGTLSGHAIGNLLIAALVDQCHGDFELAISKASEVLNIRGRVVPSTLSHVGLRALLEGGVEISGETAIASAGGKIRRVYLDPPDVDANKVALAAIQDADLIVVGPGSVFTSIIPNLLVPGVKETITASPALKVYVCNVMTQPGESEGFSASEHVTAILNSVETRLFDFIMINDGIPSEDLLERYRGSGQHLVDADSDRIRAVGFRVVQGNFMNQTDVVRHDPMRVAARLIALLEDT
jgi:uncharacterized cofD-like protein